ncbi:winged helix-turn-helix transcriptional regulator [Dictyobacter arantiisoli]|uniref:winged helix-turn-helix transcriptional regulator n=1 Tax=Dictyobacter arantiisoli TaxID=2014874 RepID=UPI001F241B7D|nr:winged helix-turn-helix transcriptional regulator [Dictyobacter arantiisoli]
MRFGQFKQMLLDIIDKMLTQQLHELEADGLITQRVYPVVLPKVETSCAASAPLRMRLYIPQKIPIAAISHILSSNNNIFNL